MKEARTELFTMRMSLDERKLLDKVASKYAMKASQFIRFVLKREKEPCPRFVDCPVHDYERHGEEAEELRSGIEDILDDYGLPENGTTDGHLVEELQTLLDSVDARDSLAFQERNDGEKAKRKTKKSRQAVGGKTSKRREKNPDARSRSSRSHPRNGGDSRRYASPRMWETKR